jgi:hypothetical protein
MTVHLVKLCVGVDSVQALRDWQAERLAQRRAAGEAPVLCHKTTQTPRRREALLDGGSLYWVIKGLILLRQPILDLRPDTRSDGRACCAVVFAPELIGTRPRPRRAFQGWRYLEPADAPTDAGFAETGQADLPIEMARELRELCLIEA